MSVFQILLGLKAVGNIRKLTDRSADRLSHCASDKRAWLRVRVAVLQTMKSDSSKRIVSKCSTFNINILTLLKLILVGRRPFSGQNIDNGFDDGHCQININLTYRCHKPNLMADLLSKRIYSFAMSNKNVKNEGK